MIKVYVKLLCKPTRFINIYTERERQKDRQRQKQRDRDRGEWHELTRQCPGLWPDSYDTLHTHSTFEYNTSV